MIALSSYLLKGESYKLPLINPHPPKEDKDDEVKDVLYEHFDCLLWYLVTVTDFSYGMKVVVGNFWKSGGLWFWGKRSPHDISSDWIQLIHN